MTRNVIVTTIVAVVIIAGFVLTAKVLAGSAAPPITGYAEGQKISFIHTEASDPQIADLLTKMKDSPVLDNSGAGRLVSLCRARGPHGTAVKNQL